jgi:hypothetical protein
LATTGGARAAREARAKVFIIVLSLGCTRWRKECRREPSERLVADPGQGQKIMIAQGQS